MPPGIDIAGDPLNKLTVVCLMQLAKTSELHSGVSQLEVK